MDPHNPLASTLLTDSGQAALRDAALYDLATLPFPPGAPISRILWLMFLCPLGIQTRAVIPVDDKLDMPDPGNMASLCDLIALCMEHAEPGTEVSIVLRRPDTAGISDADEYIFRVMSEAAASRDTVPWTFYVAGPDGVHEVSGRHP
jgi:hypothetical protein